MKAKQPIIVNNEFYESFISDGIYFIRVRGEVFKLVVNLNRVAELFEVINMAEECSDVKALCLLNEKDVLGESAYDSFMDELMAKDQDSDSFRKKHDRQKELIRGRELTVINRTILAFYTFSKPVISAFKGQISTPFFGTALSADLRIATCNTEYIPIHNKYGLHPSGALPFLLQKFVSKPDALKLLYSRDPVHADELFKLKLIDEIFPENGFDERLSAFLPEYLETVKHNFCQNKKLINYDHKELTDYLELESCMCGRW